jgi:protein-L-isoaspartate(D-aspartate) O-methyltransferase
MYMKSEIRRTNVDTADDYSRQREQMVSVQIEQRGVQDPRILKAMRKVPRHLFVPDEERAQAYRDYPLGIGYDQTISQPYIVAYMTEKLLLQGHEKVLEIGAGSGYQSAVLAELVYKVYSIEIISPLCENAVQRLKALNYENVLVRCGDGNAGWPEAAPFDAIIITAAPSTIPQELLKQLAAGGRMILPLGEQAQELVLIAKSIDGAMHRQRLLPVRFVPMTGQSTHPAN